MQDIGSLKTFEAIQLQATATLVKSTECLGPQVSSWKPSDIRTIGVIIGSTFASILYAADVLRIEIHLTANLRAYDKTRLCSQLEACGVLSPAVTNMLQ